MQRADRSDLLERSMIVGVVSSAAVGAAGAVGAGGIGILGAFVVVIFVIAILALRLIKKGVGVMSAGGMYLIITIFALFLPLFGSLLLAALALLGFATLADGPTLPTGTMIAFVLAAIAAVANFVVLVMNSASMLRGSRSSAGITDESEGE